MVAATFAVPKYGTTAEVTFPKRNPGKVASYLGCIGMLERQRRGLLSRRPAPFEGRRSRYSGHEGAHHFDLPPFHSERRT